ncbi:MAG: HEAT repeat domain-containing protein [Cyanobacteria bacterium J06555_12]
MSQDNNSFALDAFSQGSSSDPVDVVSTGDSSAPIAAVPIYNDDLSPASPLAQARVDRLIDHVNRQIEILAFDAPEPFLLRQMVQCLVDPRRATRLNLVESFSQIGETATPFLVEGIANHAESVVRRACCNALTNIGDPQAIPVLVKALLTDADTGVKSAAAGALSKVGAPAFDALRAVLASKEASESCKGHAAWAIATMSSEVSERLFRSMSDPSASVRTAVIGAIAQLLQKQIAQQAQPSSASTPEHLQPRFGRAACRERV